QVEGGMRGYGVSGVHTCGLPTASIMRRSLRILDACERLRARKNPGTAIAASNAMMATTIMISTRVKPPRRLLSLFNIMLSVLYCLSAVRGHPSQDQL